MAASKYDLTSTLVKYFDRHFVFPMLEFLGDNKIYDEATVNKLRLQQLEKTNMFELYDDAYKMVHGKEPNDDTRRNEIENEWQAMEDAVTPIVQLLESEEVTDKLNRAKERDSNTQVMQFLIEKHDFTEDTLDTLYQCAKFKYDCGHYEFVSTFLHMYIALLPPTHKNYVNALWGQVAADILLQNWQDARENIAKLRIFVDGHAFASEMEQLQQRAWLIHWTLWIAFFSKDALEDVIELCLNQQNMNYQSVMLVVCPHVLRYLTVAVVTSRKRKVFLKDLVRIIKLEQSNYSDPITELLLCLHVKYDFDGAQTKLRECEEVLRKDMFLQGCADDFIDNARQLIFEMFCRIHQKITISMLAEKLNMAEDQAERWLVNLIRNAQLNAKIDAAKGQVIMGTRSSSLHEQVMDMTKRLSLRAQSTSVQLEKSAKEKMGAAAYMDMYTA